MPNQCGLFLGAGNREAQIVFILGHQGARSSDCTLQEMFNATVVQGKRVDAVESFGRFARR